MRTLRNLLLASMLVTGVASAQSKTDLSGAWRVTEYITNGPDGSTNSNPQPGLFLFTGKHYSFVRDFATTPRPDLDLSKASDAELGAVLRVVGAQAGTYEISGGTLTLRPIVAMNPRRTHPGTSATLSFKLEGNTLVLTQKGNEQGPAANPMMTKLTRVE